MVTGELVPIPKLPKKYEVAVVVAIKLPTVNWVPVAMRAVPFEFETTIEFGEKLVEPVPPDAIVLENEPLPTQLPFTA